MADGRKGARPRPKVVPLETFDQNFDRIFGKPYSHKQVVIDAPPVKETPPKPRVTFGPKPE